MATYIFENMSPSDAASFAATDTLVFSTPAASATTVQVAPYVTPNASGSLAGTGINLTYNGETLTFSTALSTASQSGHILFHDGSDLVIGSNSADAGLGATGAASQQVIYGLDGNDTINLSANNDFVYGGTGDDTIGATTANGNYHIYGDAAGNPPALGTSQTDADTITTGYGSSYINGNAGVDTISVGSSAALPNGTVAGNNTVFGGADNDIITVLGAGFNHVNGNKGADTITATNATGNNELRGGAGNDTIYAGKGHDTVMGDNGNDDLYSGTTATHLTVLTGGSDGMADNFHFTTSTGTAVAQGAVTIGGSTYYNEITDFTAGTDHIALGFTVATGSSVPTGSTFSSAGILLQDTGVTFTTETAAAGYAQQLLNSANHTGDVAAIQVGNDTYLFYDSTQSAGTHTIDSIIKLDGVTATSLSQTTAGGTGAHDFTAATFTH